MNTTKKFAAPFIWLVGRRYATNSLLLLAVMLLTLSIEARENTLHFSRSERSLQPGEVVLYDIQSTHPLKQLNITAFERIFPAFTTDEGSQWTCLVGIDRDAQPGRYSLTLQGIDRNGGVVSSVDTLVVSSKEWETRILQVEPKYVSPKAEDQDRIKKEREKVISIFESISPEKLWHGPFQAPVPGKVTSAFGKRSVFNGQTRSSHSGTDFRGSIGTPIQAPNAGRVVLTGDLYYSGNTVILDHGLGMYSYLGHMSAITVQEGDRVQTGDIVGKVGDTGRASGPHLHWTVRLRISRVDPISLLSVLKDVE